VGMTALTERAFTVLQRTPARVGSFRAPKSRQNLREHNALATEGAYMPVGPKLTRAQAFRYELPPPAIRKEKNPGWQSLGSS